MRLALAALLLVVACTDDRKSDKLSRAECERYGGRFVQGADTLGDPELTTLLRAQIVDGCVAGDTDRAEFDCLMAAKTGDDEVKCAADAEERRAKSKRRP